MLLRMLPLIETLTVTLFQLLVTHLKYEWLLWAGLAIAEPEFAVATLALQRHHVDDRKVVPVNTANGQTKCFAKQLCCRQ